MGDENPIRTLGDYSKPSHEGYRNTIKLPVGNNIVPLRPDTIRVNVNSLTINHVSEKLHDTDPQITFRELGAPQGEVLGRMKHLSANSCSWSDSSYISEGANLQVPGQVTYLVASLTFDRARSCVMQVTSLAQGKVSNIPTVHNWDGSIGPDGFLPFILLLVVIVVAVVIVVVAVILVVVVVVVDSSIIKLS
nr:zinc finger, CCHC-type [Tanacetum cinerariifolium]